MDVQGAVRRRFETEIQLAEGDAAVPCLLDLHDAIIGPGKETPGAVLVENVGDVCRPGAYGMIGEELRRTCWRSGLRHLD